jgi:hypothetical protein
MEPKMPNTILFTPTNEQLVQISKDHPELNESITKSVLEELKIAGIKYTQKKLQHQAINMYENLYNEVQKKFFTGSSWSSNARFSLQVEKQFTEQMEQHIATALNNEFEEYLTSKEFQNLLKVKIREKILSSVLKGLEAEILEETKKLMN